MVTDGWSGGAGRGSTVDGESGERREREQRVTVRRQHSQPFSPFLFLLHVVCSRARRCGTRALIHKIQSPQEQAWRPIKLALGTKNKRASERTTAADRPTGWLAPRPHKGDLRLTLQGLGLDY